MAHIPRRFSQTAGIPAEFLAPPNPQPALPVRTARQEQQQSDDAEKADRKSEKTIGIKRLNLHDFKMPPSRVASIMFGKEAKVNDATGQLIVE